MEERTPKKTKTIKKQDSFKKLIEDEMHVSSFSYMFQGCLSLSDIKALENWNFKKDGFSDFSYMFSGCRYISNIKPLYNWKFPKMKNIDGIFFECNISKDSKLLKKWKLTEEDFSILIK